MLQAPFPTDQKSIPKQPSLPLLHAGGGQLLPSSLGRTVLSKKPQKQSCLASSESGDNPCCLHQARQAPVCKRATPPHPARNSHFKAHISIKTLQRALDLPPVLPYRYKKVAQSKSSRKEEKNKSPSLLKHRATDSLHGWGRGDAAVCS